MTAVTNSLQSVPSEAPAPAGETDAVFAKVTRKLIPMLFIAYLLNFIDRANIGFAQLQMKQSLGYSDAVYGLGASMFFVGYLIMEVPSNLMLKKVGARLTILRIMILWGATSAATAFVTTPMQFYVLRFLLGLFEAGFFPGVVLYLTFWYPKTRRAKVLALFCMASVAAAFITSPVSGAILKHMHAVGGLEGWQWMFLIEGLPTVLMGLYIFYRLPNQPENAAWLSERERAVHQWAMTQAGPEEEEKHSFALVLRDPYVYLLALAGFISGCAGYFLAFWTPTIIKEVGVTDLQMIGLYAVIPNFFGLVFMYLWGARSDQQNEQRWHHAIAFLVAAVGFLMLSFATKIGVGAVVGAIIVGGGALVAASPVYWAMATRYLSKDKAPAGIAFINTLASAAGISPTAVGAIKTQTGSLDLAIYILVAMLALGGFAILFGMKRALAGK